MEILCFYAGLVFFASKNLYLLFFLSVVLFFRRNLKWLVWFLLAIAWGALHQVWVTPKHMPDNSVSKEINLRGYIASIPINTLYKTQFLFHVSSLNHKKADAIVQLSCYKNCPSLSIGEFYQLKAKLQQPHNLSNPGGFDYVAWLHAHHIYWTGSVRGKDFFREKMHDKWMILPSLREKISNKLGEKITDKDILGILEALTLGLTTHIDKSLWDLFRHTGTTHLMVISGAHIGLLSGLFYGLFYWLWRFGGRVCLWIPANRVASIFAVIAALTYALLAGFGVPAERSFFAGFFIFLRYFSYFRFSAWQSWRYALFIVLLIEPHAIELPGFYLSFIAVAILFIINRRFPQRGIKKTLIMQLACLIGLMPLTLFWFAYGAVNGFVANLLAIPWVGFLIVPLALLATLLCQWFTVPWLFKILEYLIHNLINYLSWVDSFAFINLTFTFNNILCPLFILLAMVLFVVLPIRPLFPATIILFLAGFFSQKEHVLNNQAKIDVLDVGQGLSVLVRTKNHVLVYDTGMQFYHGTDMGKLVIIPYLNYLGVKSINSIVISHPDLDHRGGLKSLLSSFKVDELLVDNPAFYHQGASCHHYPDWIWDGVKFHFFPITQAQKSKNNASCVLQISTGNTKILLTGDIEQQAELELKRKYGAKLKSTYLLVPHHASKTSISAPFLDAVSAKYAIAAYGANNRYHFPHKETLESYAKRNIPIYNTADCGMINILLSTGDELKPKCYNPKKYLD